MDRLTLPELNIDELTAEAMRLLDVELDDLYAVLGCQLMGVARPAQAADLLSHERSLPGIAAGEQAARTGPLRDAGRPTPPDPVRGPAAPRVTAFPSGVGHVAMCAF